MTARAIAASIAASLLVAALLVAQAATYGVGATVNPTTTVPEVEEHIDVFPGREFRGLVTAVIDLSAGPRTKFAFSRDNGTKWEEGFVPLTTADGNRWAQTVDPVVAIDRQIGNVYLSNLYQNGGVVNNLFRGVYVGVQTFGDLAAGIPANQTFPVETGAALDNFPDKPWIAVDNSNGACAGNVYAVWFRQTPGGRVGMGSIRFASSSNQGRNWTFPRDITPVVDLSSETVQGPQVAVGPAFDRNARATVYVAYDSVKPGAQARDLPLGQIFVRTSTDCGRTFGAELSASGGTFNDLFGASFIGASYRLNSFPALAASKVDGSVGVAWAACTVTTARCDGGNGSDIMFARRPQGAAAFAAPVVVNSPRNGHQFFPALTTDNFGVYHSSWLDNRRSVTPQLLLGNALSLDVFATFAKGNGAGGFRPNARVTAATFAINAQAGTIGDYIGIAARDDFAFPVWNNGDLTQGRLQFARLTVP